LCRFFACATGRKFLASSFCLEGQEEEGVAGKVWHLAPTLTHLTARQLGVKVTLGRQAEVTDLAVDSREAVATFADWTNVPLYAGALHIKILQIL
jgi:hypothetical protein